MKKKNKVAIRTLNGFGTIVVGAITVDVRRRSGGKDRFLVKVSMPSEQAECGAGIVIRESAATRDATRDSSLPEKARE